MVKKNYIVTGMTCASCVSHVEKAVKKVPSVEDVTVSLLTNSMSVTFKDKENDQAIFKAVKDSGYSIKNISENKKDTLLQSKDDEVKKLSLILLFSFIILIPLFYLSMGYMLSWNIGVLKEKILLLGMIEFLLSSIILVLNKRFFISGFKSVIHKSPNMDTLVSLGSLTAFIYSLIIYFIMLFNASSSLSDWDLIMHYSMNLNFETAGMVPTLITIGKLLEAISKGKTTSAIESLLKLSVKEATIVEDEKERTVLIDDVKVSDILVVKAGEYFPVDGIIERGTCSVDESSLTGESIPVYKKEGDIVKSSTINLNGVIYMKATKVGSETTLNKIIEMVKNASSSKAPINRIADKVSGVFVPIVLLISLITLILWLIVLNVSSKEVMTNNISYAINRAISVLVIACPCALGLATPVAIMVSSGKAAKNGILFKNAESLENISHADFVVFDKTGTLTIGKPVVSDIISCLENYSEDDILKIIYSLEKNSKHPLAVAVNKKAEERNIISYELVNFKEIAGVGLTGVYEEKTFSTYSLKEIKNKDIEITDSVDRKYNELSSDGKTVLFVIINDEIVGILAVKDVVKDDAKKTILELKKMNIVPIMLTGDNKNTASKIASEVGIDYYISEILPEDKLSYISSLQKFGKVVMVGDGINDAPALSKADVSIAVSSGSDVAIDSGDVVLLKNSLIDVSSSIKLSRHTMINIKENLFFAFIYNIVMISIACGLFYFTGNEFLMNMKPYYGALAMSMSSVCVILNALRINLYDIYKSHDYRHKKVILNDEFYSLFKIDNKLDKKYVKKILIIDDMMCDNCKKHISETLDRIEAIKSYDIDVSNHEAIIEIDKSSDVKIVTDEIVKIGYHVSEVKDI